MFNNVIQDDDILKTDVVILDTGEGYHISLDKDMTVVKQLYSLVGTELNIIQTGFKIDRSRASETQKILYDTIGHIQPSRLTLATILNDIKVVLDFAKVRLERKAWETWEQAPNIPTETLPLSEPELSFISQANYSSLDSSDMLINLLYINSMNVCVVFKHVSSVIKEVCANVPDFELIDSIPISTVSSSVNESLISLFHKKCFSDKKTIKDKIETFKSLYGIGLTHFENDLTLFANKNEKDYVVSYMNSMYDLSKDINHRIRASELYNILGKFVDNKKRIAGFLVEMGLTKKRFSDGYYYFGVKEKYTEPVNTDLKGIEQTRELQLELWGQPTKNQSCLILKDLF